MNGGADRQVRRSEKRTGTQREKTWRHRWPAASACACVALGSVLLAGCSNQRGLDLARQACQHVDRSLTLYQESTTAASPSVGGAQRTRALTQLRAALPLAASAAGEANQWQGLMATLAESAHLPESDLVRALRQQCTTAEAGQIPDQVPTTPAPTRSG